MRPVFYTDLLLESTEFQPACDVYLEWCLGIRRFQKQARSREAAGLNPRWSLKELLAGATFNGHHDARLITRAESGRFVLQMVHRDQDEESEFWHVVAELSQDGGGTRLRHAQGRTGPRHRDMRPKLGAPAVVRRLLDWNGPNVIPKNIGDGSVVRFKDNEAEDVLRYLILDKQRRCGLVVVSPIHSNGLPMVGPETLARHLAGQVRVLFCADLDASKAFSRGLQQYGFSDRFGVWDGAVRLYQPGITLDDDPYRHRFWSRERLETYEPEALVDTLAGEIAERAIQGTLPPGFFSLIDRFDRAQVERRSVLLLENNETRGQDLTRQAALIEQLRAQIEDMGRSQRGLEAELLDAQETSDYFDRECAAAQQERDEARAKVVALGLALANRSDASNFSNAQRAALAAIAEGREPTPEQCLYALSAIYSDRIEILPEAYTSARERASFQQGRTLFTLLVKLATGYWQRMADGGAGDGVAGDVFGAKFAAKESEGTMNSPRARRERSFTFGTDTYVMWRHLTIGVNDGELIRVHFEWLPRARKILIGHCGRHLYLQNH